MTLPVGRGARYRPQHLRAVRAADVNLLSVQNVVVSVARRAHLDARQVGARARLGEKLPGANLAPEDRGQELVFLLVAAPDEDASRRQDRPPLS